MRRKNNTRIIVIATIGILSIGAFCIAYKGERSNVKDLDDGVVAEQDTQQGKETVEGTSYVTDTSYTGTQIPEELFETPFETEKTTEYIANKDLIKQLDDDEVSGYLNTANDYMLFVFGNDYLSILDDQDKFVEDYLSYKVNNGVSDIVIDGETNNDEKRAEKIMEWYVDYKTEVAADFITDTSLVFEKDYSYVVRGELDITCYTRKACKKFKDLFGTKLTYKETDRFLVEVYFVPGETDKIWQMQILDKIEGA